MSLVGHRMTGFSCVHNIHEKISPYWLAERMSFIPKQRKNLKFFECTKTKLAQKVEIECKNLKLNWLTGKSRKRNSQLANQIFCFQIKGAPDGAIFPAWYACVPSAQPSPYTGSCNFVSLWKNLLVLIYSKLHSKSFNYLYKENTRDCMTDLR